MPSILQANAGPVLNRPLAPPQALPLGVPQPGAPMGGPAPMGTPAAGLASLPPSGYRGPNPVTSIGRGATDFSGFPGAMNGVSPLMSAPSGMPLGMGQPPQGMPGMPDMNAPATGANAFGPPMPNLQVNPAGGFMPPQG